MTERHPDGPDLGPVLGMGVADVRLRLGVPVSDRVIGRDTWWVYTSDRWNLRIRLGASSSPAESTVRSWTLRFATPASGLSDVLRSIGLRAEGASEAVPGSGGRLVRCGVSSEAGRASLTAGLRDGAVESVTVFDEEPDWEEGPA